MDADLPSSFDVVIVGTSVAHSLAASQLAKQGLSILHLDPSPLYGSQHASLTLDEFQSHVSALPASPGPTPSYPSIIPPNLDRLKKRYAISLAPGAIPSRGPMVDTLIRTDVGKYVTFRRLDRIKLWSPAEQGGEGGWVCPPGTKAEVFKSKQMSLLEKRRLMKFLLFAGGEFESSALLQTPQTLLSLLSSPPFSLPPTLARTLLLTSTHADTLDELAREGLGRLRKYLRSVGRFGGEEEEEGDDGAEGENGEEKSGEGEGGGGTGGGWLVGMYGGAGELVQAFCRAAAVHGATYILGHEGVVESLIPLPSVDLATTTTAPTPTTPVSPPTPPTRPRKWQLRIPASPHPIECSHILLPPDHPLLPSLISTLTASTTTSSGATGTTAGGQRRRRKVNGVFVVEGTPGCCLRGRGRVDDVVLVVFPPGLGRHEKGGEGEEGGEVEEVVRGLFVGPGSGSCPDGQYLLYLQATTYEPTADLGTFFLPFLTILFPAPELQPSYSSTYLSLLPPAPPSTVPAGMSILRHPGEGWEGEPEWLEGMDWEAGEGERLFREVLGELGVVEVAEEEREEADGMY